MIQRYIEFTAAVSSLHYSIQKIERTEMVRFGLKGPHAQCLARLNSSPEILTVNRLCEQWDRDRGTISRLVLELEKAKLLRRQYLNSTHFRSHLVLTERGREVAQAVQERAVLAVEQAARGLTREQREAFYQMAAIVGGNLHTFCEQGLEDTEAGQMPGEMAQA